MLHVCRVELQNLGKITVAKKHANPRGEKKARSRQGIQCPFFETQDEEESSQGVAKIERRGLRNRNSE